MNEDSKRYVEILDVTWNSHGAKIVMPRKDGQGTGDMIVANDAKETVNAWKGKKGWLQIKWMETNGKKWPMAIGFQEGDAPARTAGQAATRQSDNTEQMLKQILARLDRLEGLLSQAPQGGPELNDDVPF